MTGKPLWKPNKEFVRKTHLSRFIKQINREWDYRHADYNSLHKWSVKNIEKFWQSVWNYGSVIAETGGDVVLRNNSSLPKASFFPDAKLNFAENLLRCRENSPALYFAGENGVRKVVSFSELYSDVSKLRQALMVRGLQKGERVAAILPNVPDAITCMLATTSIGAIWASCSPDFGQQGILDRFKQISPKILFGIDRYFYGGREFDCRGKIDQVARELPTVEEVIFIPYVTEDALPVSSSYYDLIQDHFAKEIVFPQLPFNHPLYILFSSGTTGVPKCIVHGAGGTLLQHLKEHLLQTDVRKGDRIFYFTTLGWMMWNWLVSALATEASLVLYDGAPILSRDKTLFDYAGEFKINQFGVSAKFIDATKKMGVCPKTTNDLSSVRTVLSTGSPLVPESFDYVYEKVKHDVCLSSISGGTDIIGCFAAGNPISPVWRGELQGPCLGMDVKVYDEDGAPIIQEKGELVCQNSFPSMPVGFWGDGKNKLYHSTYFEKFKGVWHHGDWAEISSHGGIVIHGRSDATLNPGGIRIGTAELYRQVEQLPEIEEAIAVGQNMPNGDVRIILFVRMRGKEVLTEKLRAAIRSRIRSGISPHHLPAKILSVPDIPRTKSGKITELAVRSVIHGHEVKNIAALENPEALGYFRDLSELIIE
tara:strand:+ start:2957 stop:4906 length:1950 start_codon:yes stop_codon:yes gene_type:complete